VFDAKTMLAAFERPTFIDAEGEKYVGIPLSHPQYQACLKALDEAGTDQEKSDAALKAALELMQLPADKILALPDGLFWGAMRDFFRCCRAGPPAGNGTP
jgi:hypothetical protein